MTESPVAPDPRWTPIQRLRDAAIDDLSLAISLWDEQSAATPGRGRRIEEKAIQKCLQDAYASIEQVMLRMLAYAGDPKPVGSNWHEDLLVMAINPSRGRPAFARHLHAELDELRRFRHVAVHGYIGFKLIRAAPAVEAARRLLAELPAAFDAFGRDFGLLPPST